MAPIRYPLKKQTMHKKHNRSLLLLFRFLIPCCVLTTGLLPMHTAAQSLQQTRISVSFDHIPLRDALKKIEAATPFQFVFMEEDIRQVKAVSGTYDNKPVAQVLDGLLNRHKLIYKQINKNIIISVPVNIEREEAGQVTGIIKDKKTTEAVIGAIVRIGGQVTQTDIDGRFTADIVAGTYKVTVSYVGYANVNQENVVVKPGRETHLEITMCEDDNTLGEVVVTERKVTGSNIALIQQIREARAVVSGISAEQIGRSQDRDASEVVRRIPGVSVIQNRFIVIRGLPQRYNTVMLNNVTAPSFESDSRAFSFDILPSGMIDRILIYKTAVPELPGDFAGGVVKVYTTGSTARNYLNITYQASVRPNTTFRDFYEQKQSSKFWLGYDDGTYGLPLPDELKRIDLLSLEERKTLSGKFNNNWDAYRKTAPVDHRFNIDFGRKFELSDEVRLGINGGLNYSNTYRYMVVSRNPGGIMNNDYVTAYNFADEVQDHDVRLNGLVNVSLDIKGKHHIDFKNMYTHMGSSSYINRNGQSGPAASDASGLGEGQYIRQTVLSNAFRGIYSGQLIGAHELFSNTRINWVLGYTRSNYNDPDQRTRTWTASAAEFYPGTQLQERYNRAGESVSGIRWGRRYFILPEEAKTLGLDIEQTIPLGTFKPIVKAGVFVENKNRTFEFRQFAMFSDVDSSKVINESYGKSNSYTASNSLKAGYLAVELPIGKRIKLYGGLRIEDNTQELKSYGWQTVGPNAGEVNLNRQHTSLLPSFNLSYTVSEKNLLRGAYARTLNRPEFREIAPFFFLDFYDFKLAYGNPDMKIQTDIDNLDLRFEHYPAAGEMFAASLFYKRFKNPIEYYYYNGTSGRNNFQWGNALSATSYGAEVEMMIGMARYISSSSFLGKQAQHVSLLFNAAYIFSEVELDRTLLQDKKRPLYGQSPYLINAALNYTDDTTGLKLNLSYNIIGRRIIGVGNIDNPSIYELPRHSLDFTFSKKIGKLLELKGGVQNILNARFLQVQDINGDGKFSRDHETIDGFLMDNRYQSRYEGTYYTLGIGLRL
jgi:outer membrane receptor for ferrienterochelin and colicin